MTFKIHQESKIWTQAGPSWVQVGPCWAKLGPCWSYVGLCWRILGPCWVMLGNLDLFPPLQEASWSELGRQVGPKLAQVGSKFGQVRAMLEHVGAKLAHVGPKLGQLSPTWPSKLDFWNILKHFQGMFKFVSIFLSILDRFFMVFLIPRNLNFSDFVLCFTVFFQKITFFHIFL